MESVRPFSTKIIQYFLEAEGMQYEEYKASIDAFISKSIEINIQVAIETVFSHLTPNSRIKMNKDLNNSEFNMALEEEKKLFNTEKKKLRIIVIGMTRAGKTSLINCFYTWSRGW
jgi:predicted GTPase